MADNLENQGGTWHVRMSIPADVRKAFGGRKILSRSLETGLRSEAMNRRLPFLTKWKGEIAAARAQVKDLKENWRPELASKSVTLHEVVDSQLLAAIKLPPSERVMTTDVPDARIDWFIRSREAMIHAAHKWEENGPKGIVQQVVAHFETFPATMVEAVERSAELVRSIERQMTAYKYNLTLTEAAEAKAIILDPAIYKPKSPITNTRLENFRAYRKARNISAKNIDAQESKLEKLSTFLATTGKPLDFDCVSAWIDSITATSKTKQQYLNAGNTFWKWAMQNDARWKEDYKGAITPFERHDLPQLKGKAKKDVQRVAYEVNEIPTLYAAAQHKKLHALADLILLGAYTGARIEELCQLRTENVIDDEGVQSFDIVDSKTVAGIRVVPVHPALTALVKRLMEDTKDGYLIPSKANNKYGIRSDLMSKAFGRLKKELGFDEFHVFHSIRMTAITQLVRASVAGTIIAELVGHETGTVTYDVYSQGHSAAQKLEAISKLPTLTAE
jgi:integrase